MKRLIWLAEPKKEHLFDQLFEENNIIARFYNVQQMPSLTAFVARGRTIAEQDFLAVDLTGAPYTDSHILEAVRILRRLSAARPVFLAPDGAEADALFASLAEENIRNVVRLRDHTDPVPDMRECLSEEGRTFSSRVADVQNGMAARAKSLVAPLSIPDGATVSVAVAGAQARIGVTTQAVAICRYLQKLGFSPLLIDQAGGLYPSARTLCAQEPDAQGVLAVSGLAVSAGLPDDSTAWNALVTDFGALAENNLASFAAHGLRVLVCGVKPWELPYAVAAKKLLDGALHATLVSFAEPAMLEGLHKYLGQASETVPYRPDPWGTDGAFDVYKRLLLPGLRELCAA